VVLEAVTVEHFFQWSLVLIMDISIVCHLE